MSNVADKFKGLGETTKRLEKILSWSQKKAIEDAKIRIQNNGGKVETLTEKDGRQFRRVTIPSRPGLKVWSSIDCLVNYAGYFAIREM